MKVLVTGSNGFVGKNLISNLSLNKEIEILKYDIDSSMEDLDIYTKECDKIQFILIYVFYLRLLKARQK